MASSLYHELIARPEPAPDRACDAALAYAFSFLGKRWSGLVLGTLIDGPAGFAQLARSVDGISESVLSDRLQELTAAGLISRTVNEGPPLSVRYDLTDTGRKLVPALEALAIWASEFLPPAELPPDSSTRVATVAAK